MIVQIVFNDIFNISQMSKSQLIILPTLLYTSTHFKKRGLHRHKVCIIVGKKPRQLEGWMWKYQGLYQGPVKDCM